MKKQQQKNKIYIMLSFSGTYFSKFLRIFTRGKYVHVAVSLDDDMMTSYSFGRKNPKIMLPAGFVHEDLNRLNLAYRNAEFLVYEMELSPKQFYLLKKNIKKFEKEKDKYRYNIIGLLFIFFGKAYNRKYHYACSQFVGKVFQDSGIYDFKKHYSLIRPLDFLDDVIDKKMLYKGSLSEFLLVKDSLNI